MPLAVVASRALAGINAPEVRVEVHLGPGLPAFHIVGLPDAEVREAREKQIQPVLITPVARRTFEADKAVSSLGPWVEAMHAVAREANGQVFGGEVGHDGFSGAIDVAAIIPTRGDIDPCGPRNFPGRGAES